jgi:hypothetical protein
MATQIVGNTVTPFLPLDTDNSPLIGVITAVGGGNVTVEFQTAVDRQGDGGAPASLVVPSAQFDAWYDVELPVDIAPGALGTVAFGPYGKMLATVVKAFQLDIAEGESTPSPATSSDPAERTPCCTSSSARCATASLLSRAMASA